MKWIDLSSRTKLKLTGPDRARYLNGQVSNQVNQDLSHKAVQACVCNLKGKIEALVSITEREDALWIDCDESLREALFARLDRYLIADDCELTDVTDDYQLWHGFGEGEGIASNRFGPLGSDAWIPTGKPFQPEGEVVDSSFAEQLRIEYGIPKWGHEMTGDEFPAEVNLESRAVDFHKGCYLGQEIISRIKSVGKVKRSLVLLAASGSNFEFKEGDDLNLKGDKLGKVTSVVCGETEMLVLALAKRSFTESAEASMLPEGLEIRKFRST